MWRCRGMLVCLFVSLWLWLWHRHVMTQVCTSAIITLLLPVGMLSLWLSVGIWIISRRTCTVISVVREVGCYLRRVLATLTVSWLHVGSTRCCLAPSWSVFCWIQHNVPTPGTRSAWLVIILSYTVSITFTVLTLLLQWQGVPLISVICAPQVTKVCLLSETHLNLEAGAKKNSKCFTVNILCGSHHALW